MKTLPAPPPQPIRSGHPGPAARHRPSALAELDHIWQRGLPGQLLVLVSLTSLLLALGSLSVALVGLAG